MSAVYDSPNFPVVSCQSFSSFSNVLILLSTNASLFSLKLIGSANRPVIPVKNDNGDTV